MAINPRGADLKQFLAEDPGGPVVMLNLLRFADGGRESYATYSRAVEQTFLPRYGGEVVYAGDGGTPLVAEEARRGTPSCWCGTRAGRPSARWWPTPSTRSSPSTGPRR
jgi:hypothetical protein